MPREFEVIDIIDLPHRGQFIFARQVDVGESLEVTEGSLLAGIPNFARDIILTDHLQKGQIVTLYTPD